MYYSRLLLQKVLTEEEYRKIKRYDCFVNKDKLPKETKISNILDFSNGENEKKIRFCLLKQGQNVYAFSTKPRTYEKLTIQDMEELQQYASISKAQIPSELVLKLCDRGNALPLIFHPLGSQMLNERAVLIEGGNLTQAEKEERIDKLSKEIKATDGEVTSITIPYPDGEEKFIYIDKNNEFVIKSKKNKTETIYHYNEDSDTFTKEEIGGEER